MYDLQTFGCSEIEEEIMTWPLFVLSGHRIVSVGFEEGRRMSSPLWWAGVPKLRKLLPIRSPPCWTSGKWNNTSEYLQSGCTDADEMQCAQSLLQGLHQRILPNQSSYVQLLIKLTFVLKDEGVSRSSWGALSLGLSDLHNSEKVKRLTGVLYHCDAIPAYCVMVISWNRADWKYCILLVFN